MAYSRTSRESRAGSHASARFGFRIRRREIGALSMIASAAGVSGMFTMRRRRLFGRRMIARLPSGARLISLRSSSTGHRCAGRSRARAAPRPHAGREPAGRKVDLGLFPDDLGSVGALVEARDAVQVIDRDPLGVAPGRPAQRELERVEALVGALDDTIIVVRKEERQGCTRSNTTPLAAEVRASGARASQDLPGTPGYQAAHRRGDRPAGRTASRRRRATTGARWNGPARRLRALPRVSAASPRAPGLTTLKGLARRADQVPAPAPPASSTASHLRATCSTGIEVRWGREGSQQAPRPVQVRCSAGRPGATPSGCRSTTCTASLRFFYEGADSRRDLFGRGRQRSTSSASGLLNSMRTR